MDSILAVGRRCWIIDVGVNPSLYPLDTWPSWGSLQLTAAFMGDDVKIASYPYISVAKIFGGFYIGDR